MEKSFNTPNYDRLPPYQSTLSVCLNPKFFRPSLVVVLAVVVVIVDG